MNAATPDISGFLVVDKPKRVSSTHVVRVIKRRLINAGAPRSIKVGHAGTLDPLASGVIVVLVGKATKHCDRIMAGRKEYLAEIDVSRTSTTDDEEGEITEIHLLRPPERAEVETACAAFVGEIAQRPPAHSALWVRGVRAYDLARKGKSPDLEPRTVNIHAIDVIDYEFPIINVRVLCGKGVYIRSLARDLGQAIGAGGMLANLRRTAVEPYTITDAIHLDEVPDPLPFTLLRPLDRPHHGPESTRA